MAPFIAIGLLFFAALGGLATAQDAAAPLSVVQADLEYSQNSTLDPFVPIIEFAMEDQTVKAIFDTGSSDIVVPQAGSPICQDAQQQCDASSRTGFVAGAFDPNAAQDVAALNEPLDANFANGAGFQGSFIKTAAGLGGATIPGTQFGLFSNGNLPPKTPLSSIFGVGPVQGEAAPGPYPNLVAHMKNVGTIKSNAFGLYTNDFRAGSGSVVFGGVDTAKFTGELQEAPIQSKDDGTMPSFVIQFSSLKMVMGGGRLNSRAPRRPPVMNMTPRNGLGVSLLDSGNPGIGIPAASIKMMARALGTTFSPRAGLGPVDCNLLNSQSMLMFGFNQDKIKINVPLDTLVLPNRPGNGLGARATGCTLPISPSQDLASLGFPFLQSAYVVFDMDNQRLLLAQAKMNVTESNIQELA